MSTAAPAMPGSPRGSRIAAALLTQPLWLALTIVALLTTLRLIDSVDSDVAWQLWIAGRLHDGAHLYRDIIEVNPPLWFWMAVPVDRLASMLQLRPEPVLVVVIGGLAALSLAATNRLLGHIEPFKRTLLLAYAAVAVLGIPFVHLGQREQLVLIATLPYAALIAGRRQARAVSPVTAMAVGAAAALTFALKHYFLIVPAALELWLLAGIGRRWQWRRPELMAIVAIGALYAASVLLWAREFLTVTVPLVRLAYGGLGAPSFEYLFGPFAVLGLVSLGLGGSQILLAREKTPFASALLVCGAAFAAAYFIQARGWIYHTLPLLGCASLALAALLAELERPTRLLRLAAPALLILPLVLTFDERAHPDLPSPDLEQAVQGLPAGESVGFLAIETAVPWSVTLQHGFRYPSRYMGYWMLNAVLRNEQSTNPDPALAALGRRVVAETVTDFRCAPPRRIVVARPPAGKPGLDILPFFLRDPEFASLLSHYRVRSRTSLETYERVSALAPPAPDTCRSGI